MTERLRITRVGRRGDGVADTPEGPIYVPYTLPGETVAVEPWPGHPDRRNLARVETASPQRVEPICPHFGICGGCATQHWPAAGYRDWKRGLVIDAMMQAGIRADDRLGELIDAHGAGRRRAVFHARRGTHDVLEVGFAALHAHHVVAIDHCPVLAPGMDDAVPVAWGIAEALEPVDKPLDIQVTATESGLDVDVRGSGPLDAAATAALAALAERRRLARLTRHGELVAQRAPPTLSVGRARVTPPPGTFMQPTTEGEATLARLALAHCLGAKRVADLFAGWGPFALRLAETARVTAIDGDAAAITALSQAAAATPGLKPVTAEARDLFRRPLAAAEFTHFDAALLDPPRQGAEAQARMLAGSRIPLIIMISCNPTTFARDTKILLAAGYRLVEATPVDQFRYTQHVEIVARLER